MSQVALAGVFTAAADGHHLLISNTGETVRFTLAAGAQASAVPADTLCMPVRHHGNGSARDVLLGRHGCSAVIMQLVQCSKQSMVCCHSTRRFV